MIKELKTLEGYIMHPRINTHMYCLTIENAYLTTSMNYHFTVCVWVLIIFFASLRFQSGAMCAIIGVVGCAFPDSRFSIAFLDQIYPHSFSAKSVSKNFHGNVYLKIESVLFKVSCWMENDNYWSKIQICLI